MLTVQGIGSVVVHIVRWCPVGGWIKMSGGTGLGLKAPYIFPLEINIPCTICTMGLWSQMMTKGVLWDHRTLYGGENRLGRIPLYISHCSPTGHHPTIINIWIINFFVLLVRKFYIFLFILQVGMAEKWKWNKRIWNIFHLSLLIDSKLAIYHQHSNIWILRIYKLPILKPGVDSL